jgi:hypothetical protein
VAGLASGSASGGGTVAAAGAATVGEGVRLPRRLEKRLPIMREGEMMSGTIYHRTGSHFPFPRLAGNTIRAIPQKTKKPRKGLFFEQGAKPFANR